MLATRFTFIVEKIERTYTFTQKWLERLLLTELDSKYARGMNKKLLKRSGADALSTRRKLRKTLGIHPPLVRPRVNIRV